MWGAGKWRHLARLQLKAHPSALEKRSAGPGAGQTQSLPPVRARTRNQELLGLHQVGFTQERLDLFSQPRAERFVRFIAKDTSSPIRSEKSL